MERARLHFRRPVGAGKFTFRAYKEDDVRHTLEALFHGKCAYCEARYDVSGPVDVEHFRPKGGIEGEEHPGYWWFGASWANLLPSCLDCNRRRFQPTPESMASLSGVLEASRPQGFAAIKTGKETCFPIAGDRIEGEPELDDVSRRLADERALLLDPCTDDPGEHILFHIDRNEPLGIVFARATGEMATGSLPLLSQLTREVEESARATGISVRGAVSIQVYGLNRLALVQERTRLLWRLEFLADTVVQLSNVADELETLNVPPEQTPKLTRAVGKLRAQVERTLAEIGHMSKPDAPFSEMVKAWLVSFKAELQA